MHLTLSELLSLMLCYYGDDNFVKIFISYDHLQLPISASIYSLTTQQALYRENLWHVNGDKTD